MDMSREGSVISNVREVFAKGNSSRPGWDRQVLMLKMLSIQASHLSPPLLGQSYPSFTKGGQILIVANVN